LGDWDRFMNPTVRFFNVGHLYTRQHPIHSSRLQSIEAVWSIYTAQKENTYPPILIFDKDRRITPQERELCLTVIDEETPLREYVAGLSPAAWKAMRKALQDNGVILTNGDGDEEPEPLEKTLARSHLCYEPITRIRNIYEIESLDWAKFVEKLISWDAEEKDPRLCLAHKAQLLQGIEQRLNAHALIVTNAGTGKSIHYSINGVLIDKATRNAFLGFAKSPTEVYKGTVDGESLPMGIDQIEVGNWGLLDYMFNVMEYGEALVSSGAAKFLIESLAPFAFMANPLTDRINVEKGFGIILDHLTNNPAIGRRFGVLIYGTDYKVLTNRSTPDSLDAWRHQCIFFRAIEEAAAPELERIMRSKEVWDWINIEIHGYQTRMAQISQGCNDDTIRVFFTEHGKAGQSRVRAAALQVSLVDHLKEIALGRADIAAILDHAEEVLPGFTRLNLESALNISQNVGDEKRFYAEHWLETSPEYLKEIVYAVEYARRSGVLGDMFDLGKLVDDLNYKPSSRGYTHISVCVSKLLGRKRGIVEFNQRCRENFGFSFKPEGNQLQVLLENRKPIVWIRIPGVDPDPVEEQRQEPEQEKATNYPNVEGLYEKAVKAIHEGRDTGPYAGEFWDTLETWGHPRRFAEPVLKNPDSPVEFVGFRVHVKGEVPEGSSTMARMNRIQRLLEESGKPCSVKELAVALRMREDEALRYLRAMEKSGQVTQTRPGCYVVEGFV